jgi:uncharacterized membrane protein YfcA
MWMDSFDVVLIGALAFLIAGTIKGIVGLGLPTAAIAGMTLVIAPRTAIALILFPMMFLNMWQWLKAGLVLRTVRRYWVFCVILTLGVGVSSYLSRDLPNRAMLGALGGVMLLFVVVSWGGLLPVLRPKYDLASQIGFAVFAGTIGGLTAAWAAPMSIYLTMRGVDKDEFIRASGFLITIGTFPLCLTYAKLGFLTGPLALSSIAMILPAMVGYSLGERIRNRLAPETFRRAILLVFLVLALNLIRRAVWYT